jgi:hypothetical protein
VSRLLRDGRHDRFGISFEKHKALLASAAPHRDLRLGTTSSAADDDAVWALDGTSFAYLEVALGTVVATHDAIARARTLHVAVAVTSDLAVTGARAPHRAPFADVHEAAARAGARRHTIFAAAEVAVARAGALQLAVSDALDLAVTRRGTNTLLARALAIARATAVLIIAAAPRSQQCDTCAQEAGIRDARHPTLVRSGHRSILPHQGEREHFLQRLWRLTPLCSDTECCPGMPDGREFCMTGLAGVDRCQTRDCIVGGRECDDDGDPPQSECIPLGGACEDSMQCCTGRCSTETGTCVLSVD